MMKNYSNKKTRNILLLIVIAIVLGPELYIFAPEILLFFQAAGVEYLLGSLALMFIPMKDYLLFWVQKITNNEQLRKYSILIPLVFILPFMPELAIVLELGAASTFLLATFRQSFLVGIKDSIGLIFSIWPKR